jgi:hypothetical protein
LPKGGELFLGGILLRVGLRKPIKLLFKGLKLFLSGIVGLFGILSQGILN